MGSRVLNTLSAMLSTAGIGLFAARNASYGLPELAAILAEMCRSGTAAEEAVDILGAGRSMPSAKWFRDMMHSLDDSQVQALCRRMLRHTARLARRGRQAGSVLVAIDKHLIPRHDRDNMLHLVYSKSNGGTYRFECYATMQTVGTKIGAVLGCFRVTRDDSDVDFVRRFMRDLGHHRMRPRLLLVDREFYSVDVMAAVRESGHGFLMPAIRNTGIKRAIKEHHAGTRGAVSRYTLRNSEGREFTFTLLICPSRMDDPGAKIHERYHAFATSLPAANALGELDGLPEEYRKRWGIETGYRQVEQVSPKTTSRDASYRMMLFFVSLFLYNMWSIERHRADSRAGRVTLNVMVNTLAIVALDACSISGVPPDPGGPR